MSDIVLHCRLFFFLFAMNDELKRKKKGRKENGSIVCFLLALRVHCARRVKDSLYFLGCRRQKRRRDARPTK